MPVLECIKQASDALSTSSLATGITYLQVVEMLLKKLEVWSRDEHAKVRDFAKAMSTAIKKRFPED